MFDFLNSKAIHLVVIRILTKHTQLPTQTQTEKNVCVFNQEAKAVLYDYT